MVTYVKTEGIDFFGCIVLYMFICGSIQNCKFKKKSKFKVKLRTKRNAMKRWLPMLRLKELTFSAV